MEALQDFHPTKILWISPLSIYTKVIEVYDITDISLNNTEPLSKISKRFRNDKNGLQPAFTLKKDGRFAKPYHVYQDDEEIAIWHVTAADFRSSTQYFEFTSDPISDYKVGMNRPSNLSRDEIFTKESISYTWSFDYKIRRNRLTLTQKIGQSEKIVAKFNGPTPFFHIYGALAIDENEIDILLALLSCGGMLRKDRMRK